MVITAQSSQAAQSAQSAQSAATPLEFDPPYSRGYRAYVLMTLMLINALNYMDRNLLGVLTEPIKADLGFSDAEMGLLGGLAFALFYAVMGVPIARLADTGNRRNIIAVAIGLWSGMTALCGMATGFASMFMARLGVGVGEAGGVPPSHSIIADYFPPQSRAKAMAILQAGANVGILAGMVIGALVAEKYGWRAAFLTLGIPGVLYALVIRFTLKEPPRQGISADILSTGQAPPFKQGIKRLFARKSFLHMVIAFSIASFASYGAAQWSVPFYMRTHQMSLLEIAPMLGLVASIAGALSLIAGGVLADRLAIKDLRWHFWLPLGGMIILFPLSIAIYWVDSAAVSIGILVPYYLIAGLYIPAIYASVQNVVESDIRALSIAVIMFTTSLVGLGLGPIGVGLLSDLLADQYGADSLRWALITSKILILWSAFHMWRAGRHYLTDLAEVKQRVSGASSNG